MTARWVSGRRLELAVGLAMVATTSGAAELSKALAVAPPSLAIVLLSATGPLGSSSTPLVELVQPISPGPPLATGGFPLVGIQPTSAVAATAVGPPLGAPRASAAIAIVPIVPGPPLGASPPAVGAPVQAIVVQPIVPGYPLGSSSSN